MKIQIDFPEESDRLLKIYMINNDFKTKAEAVVDLAVKGLDPERKIFVAQSTNKKTKIDELIKAPER